MATNKSKSNLALLSHVTAYTIPFMVIISPLYGLVNGVIHFIIDYNTSRVSSKLWADKKTHWFFVTIGFDQLLHALTLIWTYKLLF